MAKNLPWVVTIDGKDYDVDAPDEDTAYQWAQEFHDEQAGANYRAGREAPRLAQSAFNVLQGPTFGFADEILGGLGAGVGLGEGGSFTERYKAIRDYLRGAGAQLREDYPKSALLGNLSGGMLLAGPVARVLGAAAPATTTAGKVAQAGSSAGVAGALSGAGEAEELVDVPLEGAKGLGRGAAFGVGLSGTTSALGAVGRNVGERMSQSRLGRALGADEMARNAARLQIARALERDRPQGVTAMSTPGMLQARGDKLGEGARMVDVAPGPGVNTRQLLDTVATMPGRTAQQVEQAIRTRQAGRASRLIKAAEQAFSPIFGRKMKEEIGALIEDRAAASKPLYDKVRAASVPVDDELRDIIKLGMAKAGSKVRELADLDQVKIDLDGKTIPLHHLDTLKRALYVKETAPAATNAQTGRANEVGVAYGNLRRRLIQKLDDLTTDPKTGTSFYKEAREAYSGPTELITSMNKGFEAMRNDKWRVKDLTGDLSLSELEAFKFGAYEALRAKLGTQAGQTSVLNMWREPATREKLLDIFGDERAFREFASRASAEGRMRMLEQVGRGSQTAGRQARTDDVYASVANDLMSGGRAVANSSPLGFVQSVRDLWGRAATPEPVRDEVGRLLMTPVTDPRFQDEIYSIGGLMSGLQQRNARAASAAGLFGGLLNGNLR